MDKKEPQTSNSTMAKPSLPQDQSPSNKPKKPTTKKMPSPQELVTYYENQGMETREASHKVIQDLQSALFRVISGKRGRSENGDSPEVTAAKLDAIHARLVQVEMKVDTKPSYPQALGIGVASVGLWSGVCQIWSAVKRVNSSQPDS